VNRRRALSATSAAQGKASKQGSAGKGAVAPLNPFRARGWIGGLQLQTKVLLAPQAITIASEDFLGFARYTGEIAVLHL
jgi:hypothetical protein